MRRWQTLISQRNEALRDAGRWRVIRTIDGGHPNCRLTASGRPVVSFASNDYLGLSQHPDVVAAAHDALARFGAGSGAARLIVGSRPVHDELEAELADWCGRKAALVFPTGFQANLGVLGALARAATGDAPSSTTFGNSAPPACVIFSDALNHASIIDGCRHSGAEVVVYRHRDVAHLDALMSTHQGRPALVVTDSVFSMDGDVAPLAELSSLCSQHDALLVVDEAHAVLAAPPPRSAVVVGTLSKTLGSVGGFVAADRPVIDLCVNTARSFIFTTANAPADAAAALRSLRVLRSAEGAALLDRLRENVSHLVGEHPSPIVPVVVGTEQRALQLAAGLAERGLLVPAIRPPTVPEGTCRLRVALSAAHEPAQVHALRDALCELGALVPT